MRAESAAVYLSSRLCRGWSAVADYYPSLSLFLYNAHTVSGGLVSQRRRRLDGYAAAAA